MSEQESQGNYSSITCGLLSLVFTLPAIAWPIGVFVVPFMFDAPGSESNFLAKLLAFSTIIYGPLYLIALKESHSLRRKGNEKDAIKTWIYLCGSDAVIWIIALTLLTTTTPSP